MRTQHTHTAVTHSQDNPRADTPKSTRKRSPRATTSSAPNTSTQQPPAKPLLLDLYSGAGIGADGYSAAGFEIVGVDTVAQPNYPGIFRQGDALVCLATLLAGREWGGYVLSDFAAMHASPVCKGYSPTRHIHHVEDHPKLIASTRALLQQTGLPWVLENVVMKGEWRRHMPSAVMLCGTMFGLRVYRHRYFESSHLLLAPLHPQHPVALQDGYYCIYGDTIRGRQQGNTGNHYTRYNLETGRSAMGVARAVTRGELSQAIPPAYTEFLGRQLMAVIAQGRAA